MLNDTEHNLGEQPITGIMIESSLETSALVSASAEQLTFKMVNKACKGAEG